jgi:hypothetical protein
MKTSATDPKPRTKALLGLIAAARSKAARAVR